MLHKLIIVSLLQFVPGDQQLQAGLVVAWLFLAFLLWHQPYVRYELNVIFEYNFSPLGLYRPLDDRMHVFAQCKHALPSIPSCGFVAAELLLIILGAHVMRHEQLDGLSSPIGSFTDIGLSAIMLFLSGAVLAMFLRHGWQYYHTRSLQVHHEAQKMERRQSRSDLNPAVVPKVRGEGKPLSPEEEKLLKDLASPQKAPETAPIDPAAAGAVQDGQVVAVAPSPEATAEVPLSPDQSQQLQVVPTQPEVAVVDVSAVTVTIPEPSPSNVPAYGSLRRPTVSTSASPAGTLRGRGATMSGAAGGAGSVRARAATVNRDSNQPEQPRADQTNVEMMHVGAGGAVGTAAVSAASLFSGMSSDPRVQLDLTASSHAQDAQSTDFAPPFDAPPL